MKSKSLFFWLVLLVVLGVGGYFTYSFIKRKTQESAMKQAIEQGCADIARKFEEDQDEIADDIVKLMEKMGDIDDEDLEKELQEIHDELVVKK